MTLFFRLLARRFLRLRLLLSEYVSQGDVDFLVVLAGVGLRRAAPAAVQQESRRPLPLTGRSTSTLSPFFLEHIADCNLDVLVVLAGVGLRRAAPATVEQDSNSLQTR